MNKKSNFEINYNEIENRRDHFIELNKMMPHNDKIEWAKIKINEFIDWLEANDYKEVEISFSGGKDSTVLLDLVIKTLKKRKSKMFLIPSYAMEITFPSTLKFIKETIIDYRSKYRNVKELNLCLPRMPWNQILKEKGYPIFSKQVSVLINRVKHTSSRTGLSRWLFGMEPTAKFKIAKTRLFLLDSQFLEKWNEIDKQNFTHFFSEKCCDFVKGGLKHSTNPSFVGTLASESLLRKDSWVKYGCNILNKKKPLCRPLSLWNEKDIWTYIKKNKLKINPAYNYKPNLDLDKQSFHFKRLGCTACPLGSHIEELKFKRSNFYKEKKFNLPDDIELWNRYEILKEYYPALYQSQVYGTFMYRILVDMGITIKNDERYMNYYHQRRKQIDEWYEDIKNNFFKILFDIERYKDIFYSAEEINKSLDHFKINFRIKNENELIKYREKYREKCNTKILIKTT